MLPILSQESSFSPEASSFQMQLTQRNSYLVKCQGNAQHRAGLLSLVWNIPYVCSLQSYHHMGHKPNMSGMTLLLCPVMAGKSTQSTFPGNIDNGMVYQ